MIFRQLFDPQSSTYTYLVADSASREALLIDPVFEQARRDAALIGELGLKLKFTLETHVHADHVTGASLLRQKLGSRIAISAASGAEGADRYLRPGDKIPFGKQHLEARPTPGHTGGCTTYVLDDRSMAFTGDTLFIRGCGRVDLPGGDSEQMWKSLHTVLKRLPPATQLHPGHHYGPIAESTIGEEARENPYLNAPTLADWHGMMGRGY